MTFASALTGAAMDAASALNWKWADALSVDDGGAGVGFFDGAVGDYWWLFIPYYLEPGGDGWTFADGLDWDNTQSYIYLSEAYLMLLVQTESPANLEITNGSQDAALAVLHVGPGVGKYFPTP